MNRHFTGFALCQIVQSFASLLVMSLRIFKMSSVCFLRQQWQESTQSILHRSNKAQIDGRPTAYLFTARIDLNYLRMRWIELLLREVRAQHEQQIAMLHSKVARRKSQQSCHSDVIGIVVLDEFFTAEGVDNGSLQFLCQLEQFCVGTRASCASEDGDPRRRA